MKKRGTEFLKIPDTYYDSLRKNLQTAKISVVENFDTLQVLF